MSDPSRRPQAERRDIAPYLLQFRILKIQVPDDESLWYPGSNVPIQAWTPVPLQPGEEARAYLLDAANPAPLFVSPSSTSAPNLQFTLPLPDPNKTYYILAGIYNTVDDSLIVSDLVRVYTVDIIWGDFRKLI
jgi:hypothetical protein